MKLRDLIELLERHEREALEEHPGQDVFVKVRDHYGDPELVHFVEAFDVIDGGRTHPGCDRLHDYQLLVIESVGRPGEGL